MSKYQHRRSKIKRGSSSKQLTKSFFRDIWALKGKFVAIVLITLLGTMIFAALQSIAPDMRETAKDYYKNSNLMDLELQSASGVSQSQIDKLAKNDNISKVEGADLVDLLDDDDNVYRLHSLPEEINQITVLEGHLPDTDTQIVVGEGSKALGDIPRIGDKVQIASSNEVSNLGLLNTYQNQLKEKMLAGDNESEPEITFDV
ncbi:MAG: hypothetical protein LBM13_00215, partial [Candidatus Ancillula sp.]|nr:hypothetical protein [Candidatus Ancillula sp.]